MRLLTIQPRNILSFGPDSPELVLGPLNVLIGPNGSGKSNLIHVVALLRAAATDLAAVIREDGDATHWIWRHGNGISGSTIASIEATFSVEEEPYRYGVAFQERRSELFVVQEELSSGCALAGRPAFRSFDMHRTREAFAALSIYRDWAIGSAPALSPQKPNLRRAVLDDDAGNLGLVLNRLNQDHAAKTRLLDALRELYDNITDFRVNIEHDSVTIVLREGDVEIPAARLSDGTLRYLCLLAILCHPRPPPVVCLEEPELGLHPDILPGLADLLKDASTRCQLIVTTHSDVLIDRLSDTPESVVVCEKHDGQTQMRRLEAGPLKPWLERYTLGELWTKGELGGNRW